MGSLLGYATTSKGELPTADVTLISHLLIIVIVIIQNSKAIGYLLPHFTLFTCIDSNDICD